MFYVAIIIFLVTVFLLTRLYVLKKELKNVMRQLQSYNNRTTNKKIDMALFDKDIENIGLEINKLIDLYVVENSKRVRFENEQRQTIANMRSEERRVGKEGRARRRADHEKRKKEQRR